MLENCSAKLRFLNGMITFAHILTFFNINMKRFYTFLTVCLLSVAAWAALPVGSFTIDFRTLCEDLPTSGSAVTVGYNWDASTAAFVKADAAEGSDVVLNNVYYKDAQHGIQRGTITINTSSKTLLKIGGCQYGSGYTVTDGKGKVLATIDKADRKCDSQTSFDNYNEAAYNSFEPTALTISETGYIPYVMIEVFSAISEQSLYETNFSDWTAGKTTAVTKYTNETIEFTLTKTEVNPSNVDWAGKFPDAVSQTCIRAEKSEAFVETSVISSVSKVRFLHGATGSNRGWGLYAKGEGDADWVLISDAVASNAKGTEVIAEVNKTNCQLRFYNLNTSQNAYMFELEIQGLVDMSQMPALGTFEVNGVAVEAVDIFEIDAEGNYAATYEISKTAKMISAENPLTNIVAANGTVGEVTYQLNATADTCVCTIPVSLTAGGKEIVANYILTVILKPDFTVTYYDVDGTTVLATQTVEKDAAVAAFAADASKVTVAEGHVFRGWFVAATGEDVRKYSVDEIIVGNTAFYARTTPEEVAEVGTRYAYNLNHQHFDAADHESFSSNGSFHDTQHGWDFSAGEYIKVKVCSNAIVILGCCKYSASGAIAVTNEAGDAVGEIADAYVENDGATVSFEYTGPATELTFTFSATTYIHQVIINNLGENAATVNEAGYYVVEAGNVSQFLTILELAQSSKKADERAYIYLPNGVYDMGEAVLTPISANNISIIGESMEKTIIRNAPDKSVEGIGTTATFLITGKNTYFQDLTIQNALDYYGAGSAGRAVCLQDRGANTICKNVRLLSYQDTYYSNNDASQFYFGDCDIHGTVDFVCGGGDVYYDHCLFTLESRKAGVVNGGVTIAAPNGDAPFGYVMESCTIDPSMCENFNYGRAWGGAARLAYLNTKVLDKSKLVASHFTREGMNVASQYFREYNTVDAEGNAIAGPGVQTFFKGSTEYTYDVTMTADQAAAFAYDKVFTAWDPRALSAQLKLDAISTADGKISWTAVEGAKAYAVFLDGVLLDFTTECSFKIAEDQDAAKVQVRVANAMGGLGEVTGYVNALSSLTKEIAKVEYYNALGQRLPANAQGMTIVKTIFKDGSVNVEKCYQK